MEQRIEAKTGFLTGWKYPVTVDAATGRIRMSSGEENIEESVRLILGTRKGERAAEPEFGCGIWDYSFDTLDDVVQKALEQEAEHALSRWEPRIAQVQVRIRGEEEGQGRLLLHVSYTVCAAGSRRQIVYPFDASGERQA